MELEVFHLVTSDICKLVYGFLLEIDLFPVAVQFLDSSPYLAEFSKVRKQNRMFICSVNGLSLKQWLEKAALVYSVEKYIKKKCLQFKIDSKVMRHKNILEQLDILLKYAQLSKSQSTNFVEKKTQNKLIVQKQEFFSSQVVQNPVQEIISQKPVQERIVQNPVQERITEKPIQEQSIHTSINKYVQDENVFKKLTDKDKKILVDVFEKADTVSELLAQKISEELNKKSAQSDINTLAHQVAETTASDHIFDDLCAEMYEEGFLADFALTQKTSARKSASPRKYQLTPHKTKPQQLFSGSIPPSEPPKHPPEANQPSLSDNPSTRLTSQVPLESQSTHETVSLSASLPSSGPNPSTLTPHSPQSQSTLPLHLEPPSPPEDNLPDPLNSSSPKSSHIQPSNSTLVDPPSSHLRPMSVSSDVSSVASASSFETGVSASSTLSPGVGLLAATSLQSGHSGHASVAPNQNMMLFPPIQSHLQPLSQLLIPANQNGPLPAGANIIGQPGAQLLLVPVVSQGNMILQSPVNQQASVAPLSSHAPSPYQTIAPSATVGRRYTKLKPKPPPVKDAQNSHPYNIIVQVPNNSPSAKILRLTSPQNATGSNVSDEITNQNRSDTTTHETSDSRQNPTECSPYKLDNFISFNSSKTLSQPHKNLSSESSKPSVSSNTTAENTIMILDASGVSSSPAGTNEATKHEDIKLTSKSTEDLKNNEDIEMQESVSSEVVRNEDVHNLEHDRDFNEISINRPCSNNEEETCREPTLGNESHQSLISDNKRKVTTVDSDDRNEPVPPNEAPKEYHESQTNVIVPEKSLLDDSVQFIINEEPLDNNVVYETAESDLNNIETVIVIPPPDETILEECNDTDKDVSTKCETDQTNKDVGTESDLSTQTSVDEGFTTQGTSVDKSPKDFPQEGQYQETIEPNKSKSSVAVDEVEARTKKESKPKDFYLVKEPSNCYLVVNNGSNETKAKPSTIKTLLPKAKNDSKKSSKVLESNLKSSAEKKGPKHSPSLLEEKVSLKDNTEASATKPNSLNLDFLSSSCKVTPAVKVLSTPKRKSSSTPRRSHVRALKFETPLKPTGYKRKCNTSPKECKNQMPIVFERVEKPKNVSRNLCEDVEMKKDVIPEKQPWDVALRNSIGLPGAKLSDELKKRKKLCEKKKRQVRNNKTKKTKGGVMKTIDEEMNNSHDNAKCSLDQSVKSCLTNRNGKENKDVDTPMECDPMSNEGSCLSLNVEDTPLKVADFQDDIHDDLKTPSKAHLLPSKSLTFTPIDNIIRNNIGGSESLLKIIEDINMFKETPIKEALENLSDKSNTPPSPCKTSLVNSGDKTEPRTKKGRQKEKEPKILKNTKTPSTKKNKTSNNGDSSKCKQGPQTDPKNDETYDSSIQSGSQGTTNRKRGKKITEPTNLPLRRSLRSNSSVGKLNDAVDKTPLMSLTDEGTFKKRKKKGSSKEGAKIDSETGKNYNSRKEEKTIQASGSISKDDNVQSVNSEQNISQYSCQTENGISDHVNGELNQEIICKSNHEETGTPRKEHYHRNHSTKEDQIFTFLRDCRTENEKLKKQHESDAKNATESNKNPRKRLNSDKLESENHITSFKRKKESFIENEEQCWKQRTSMNVDSELMETKCAEEVKTEEKSRRRKKSPTKLKTITDNTSESSNSNRSNISEQKTTTSLETQVSNNELKPSDHVDTNSLTETKDRNTHKPSLLGNLNSWVQPCETALNLSASSSDKENLSIEDTDMTLENSYNQTTNDISIPSESATSTTKTVYESPNTIVSDPIEINSSNINPLENERTKSTPLEDGRLPTNTNKPSLEPGVMVNTKQDEPSDDDLEDNKHFISISHQHTNHKASIQAEKSDCAKNTNFTIEVDLGELTLHLSTASHNILDLQPGV